MKFSLSSILSHFKNFKKDINSLDFINIFNNLGLEVEEVEKKKSYDNIIIAEIKEFTKHPNADKLNICNVFDGVENKQIVCGAKNVKNGMKVALAKIGALIPNGNFTIKTSKIRGIESNGMMCSDRELFISEKNNIGYIKNLNETNSIIEFNDTVQIGESIEKYISNEDIFEIKITPDRGYATGIYGIARDLKALGFGDLSKISDFCRKIFTEKNIETKNEIKFDAIKNKNLVNNITENSMLCLLKINNIKNFKSPDWLVAELTKFGLNSINTIVDILNFLMIHFGYPMHGYDADKISLPLSIEKLTQAEKFQTLQEDEILLPQNSIVIKDKNNQICSLAGIIGGNNSKISENTKNIVIECGFFPKELISRLSNLLNIKTDALYRFERGVDVEISKDLIEIVSNLIINICEGEIEAVDLKSDSFKKKFLSLNFTRIEKILGFKIEKNEIINILKNLEFEIIEEKNEIFSLLCPYFRTEIDTENEIIAEIGRIYGYNNLPKKDSLLLDFFNKKQDNIYQKIDFINEIKQILSRDFNECISLPFVEENKFDLFTENYHKKNELCIQNAINTACNFLRNTLFIGLLEKINFNLKNYKFTNINLFESGKVFFGKEEQIDKISGLCMLNFDEEKNFFFLKSKIFYLLNELISKKIYLEEKNITFAHPNKSFAIKIDNIEIGSLGLMHPKITNSFEIKRDLWFFDLSINTLQKMIERKKFEFFNTNFYKDFALREFSILVDKNFKCSEVINAIKKLDNIKFVDIIDIFSNEKEFDSKKSISILIGINKLQEYTNITEGEFIEQEFKKSIDLTVKLGAILRDGLISK